MTPCSDILLGTSGGHRMIPGIDDLEIMSPGLGSDNGEGPWLLPDILVDVHRSGEDGVLGVIRDVLPDGACTISVGLNGDGEVITVHQNEIAVIPPKKYAKVKVIGGAHHGAIGKLMGIYGTDGVVKFDITFDIKIIFLGHLASLCANPQYQSWSPHSRTNEASTSRHGEAGTPRGSDDNEGPCLLTDILVNVHKKGNNGVLGVIKEVLPDGSYKICVGLDGKGKMVTGHPSEIEVIPPRKNEKVKVMGGPHRGAVGKLAGIDETDGIVKLDITFEIKILLLHHLARLVQPF